MNVRVFKFAVLSSVVACFAVSAGELLAQTTSCDPLDMPTGRHCKSDLQLALLPDTHIELFGDEANLEGADNWAVTWSIVGDQVAVWGDGHGANTPDAAHDGNVSLGLARIRGPVATHKRAQFRSVLRGASRKTCLKTTRYPGNLTSFSNDGVCGKSYGLLALKTTQDTEQLLLWVSPGSGGEGYDANTLYESSNAEDFRALFTVQRSATNRKDQKEAVGGLISPAFLQAGPGYTRTGQRDDEYIYIYWVYHDPKPRSAAVKAGLHIHGSIKTGEQQWRTGKIYLSRVHRDSYADPTQYQLFDGEGFSPPIDIRNTAVADVATPVFESTLGVGWTVSVAYLPRLVSDTDAPGRYVLITEHVKTFDGQFGIYESASPVGPWRLIRRFKGISNCLHNDTGSNSFYMNISTRWYAASAKRDTHGNLPLIFTGVENDDSFNAVTAQLLRRGDNSVPQSSMSSCQ